MSSFADADRPDAHDIDLAPDAWGLHHMWVDTHDEIQHVAPANRDLLREVIGTPSPDLDTTAPLVVRPGDRLTEGGVVSCEDGSTHELEVSVPPDFPFGYHKLRHADGRDRALIVSPGRCWLPADWRAWGWTVQLYAARSSNSWGIGDLRDLRDLRLWAQQLGAEFLLINPLHAVAPTLPQEASPYLPTSRRFRNPIYLCVDEVDGMGSETLAVYEQRRRELNDAELIDRDAIWQLKLEALRTAFTNWTAAGDVDGNARFAAWRSAHGEALREFAVWMVLAAAHGPDWREWPAHLHDPHGSAVSDFAAQHRADLDFHCWLQWQLDEQLRIAGDGFNLIQDLPIGVDGGGADAWAWQGLLATDVTVGAPPDQFSSQGQDWGSPPVVPWRLRAAEYQPFVESVRATMANAGGLRIDHVMGLFRIWWVPPGGPPSAGAYVRYPSNDLLDIVALESHRQQAIVVGEDLGTVEDGVREQLADRAILSYRLLWFEQDEPRQWPHSSMAAVTTHDLPTIAGLWTGADLEDQLLDTDVDEVTLQRQRKELLEPLRRAVGSDEATPEDAVLDAHRYLATSPSILLSATLDDAIAAPRRPNIPGVVTRPNWRLPLPVRIDEVVNLDLPRRLASVLDQALTNAAGKPNGAGQRSNA